MRLLRRTEAGAQHVEIADAVLQADDDGVRASLTGDQVCHFRRGAALHGHEDDLRPCQGLARVGGDGKRGRRQGPVGSVEIGDAQAVLRDGLGQGRPQQQCHVAAGQRQAPAHIAADAAGAGNDDARGPICHPAPTLPQQGAQCVPNVISAQGEGALAN